MSIELTEEQFKEIDNILDIQGIGVPENIIRAIVNLGSEQLTKDQVKQLAEQHGVTCNEWIKLDKEDESTWPEIGEHYVDQRMNVYKQRTEFNPEVCYFTHWQPLPEFKRGK
jgi:plasmid maintenance system antidote protein VapI